MKKLILFLGTILWSISLLNAQYTISPSDPFVSNGGGTWGSILKMKGISINSGKGVRFSIHKLDGKEFSQTGIFYLRSGSQTGTNLSSTTITSGKFSAFIDLDFEDNYSFPMLIYGYYQPNNVSGNAWVGEITINNQTSSEYFGFPVEKNIEVENCSFDSTKCFGKDHHHTGVDFAPSSGENILAAAYGKIVYIGVGDNFGLGKCVIIEHTLLDGELKYSLYAHLDSISSDYSIDSYLRKGDFIGIMGKTGRNDYKKHLHFEIKDAPVLHQPTRKNNEKRYWGYTPDKAENYGYEYPYDYFNKVQVKTPICTNFEPNNNYTEAPLIKLIGRNTDRKDKDYLESCLDFKNGDEDWYSIIPVNQGELTLTLNNPNFNMDLYFNGNTVKKSSGTIDSNGNKSLSYCFSGNSCTQVYVKISAPIDIEADSSYKLNFDWDYNNGCIASKTSAKFNKIKKSDLTIFGDTEICEGESTTLSVSGNGNYKWFANNNEIGTGATISIPNLLLGQNEIAVIDIDSTCSSGGNTIVTVNEGITADAGNDVSIQNGTSTQLQGSGGTTYSWSPISGLSNSNISNPLASPTQTTTYTLTTTKNGCTDTDEVTVTVSQNNHAIDIMVDDIWTLPTNPKEGEEVDLYVRVKNIGTEKVYSINWKYYINTNVVGSDDYFALDPNETREEFLNNYKFTSSGTFDYCVNIEAESNEQNTSNNDYCKQITIGDFVSEDITVSNVVINNSNIDAGKTFIASATQNYSGGRTTNELPDIKLGYYLSKDCNFSNDDIFLDEEVSSIGSDNTFENETEVVKIPSTTEGGNYYILVVADHTNLISESNENNNIVCKSIVVNNSDASTIDAGIVNPTVNGLIIHEDNRNTYILTSDLDKVRIDGWSNTGKIRNIQIYKMKGDSPDPDNDIRLYYAENANGGSWWKDADVGPGEHTVYINVKCNYNGCAQNGVNSETRKFTYVKPYVPGNFYAYNRSDDVRIDIYPNYNFGNSLNTGFYYRVYRNTKASISGGMYLGNWTQEKIVMDTNTNPNQTYYYWVDVAIDGNGNYNSGLIETEYVEVKTPTLSTTKIELSKFINIFPNPTKVFINVRYDNSIKINEISIFDVKGKLILKKEKELNKISTKNLSNGIYIISIKTNKGTLKEKIVKN